MRHIYSTIVILLTAWTVTACGTTGETSRFTLPLDLPEGKKGSSNVHVASVAMAANAAHLHAVNVRPWGKFGTEDLRNIEQSLRDTILPYLEATPDSVEPKMDVHVVIRRYVVSTSNTGGAVLAAVAWAATTSEGVIIHEEQFYASDAVYLVGTIGMLKDSVHKAVVRRIATVALAIARDPAVRPEPEHFDKTFTSFEEAAAQLPQSLLSMGNPALASFPVRSISTIGLLTPAGVSRVEWKVAEPSIAFDWTGYLNKIY